MARYFLHLKDSIDEVLDPEGVDIPAEAVPATALASARDCMAGDVKAGRLDLHYRIEVFDESGDLVHTLPFSDALEVVPPR
jgi:hypothetical protein